MKTIIINGQRELAELPEKWYTDGTEKANEWGQGVFSGEHKWKWDYRFISNDKNLVSAGGNRNGFFSKTGHTYITPSEFDRLVYQPWKGGQKVELPRNYAELTTAMVVKKMHIAAHIHSSSHINACIRLTNIMNFANDAFKPDWHRWTIKSGAPSCLGGGDHPIYFNSSNAAEWAYKTFPEIFKAYWNV